MLFIALLTAALFGAFAAANNLTPPLEGYTVSPMSWKAVNTTDGSELVLYGTIQELQHQLEAMDDVELSKDTTGADAATSAATDERARSLAPRDKDKTICWVGGSGDVNVGWLQDGIDYLKRHSGPCTADPGPGRCARVSCSWDTAIWLCNDRREGLSRPCADVATYAEDVRDRCRIGYFHEAWSIRGQEFDTAGFNVVVGKDDC